MSDLPELPKSDFELQHYGRRFSDIFTADQLREYGRLCYEAGMERAAKLEAFYREVAQLTIDHDILYQPNEYEDEDDVAVVYPSKLGKALEKVDPDWTAMFRQGKP